MASPEESDFVHKMSQVQLSTQEPRLTRSASESSSGSSSYPKQEPCISQKEFNRLEDNLKSVHSELVEKDKKDKQLMEALEKQKQLEVKVETLTKELDMLKQRDFLPAPGVGESFEDTEEKEKGKEEKTAEHGRRIKLLEDKMSKLHSATLSRNSFERNSTNEKIIGEVGPRDENMRSDESPKVVAMLELIGILKGQKLELRRKYEEQVQRNNQEQAVKEGVLEYLESEMLKCWRDENELSRTDVDPLHADRNRSYTIILQLLKLFKNQTNEQCNPVIPDEYDSSTTVTCAQNNRTVR